MLIKNLFNCIKSRNLNIICNSKNFSNQNRPKELIKKNRILDNFRKKFLGANWMQKLNKNESSELNEIQNILEDPPANLKEELKLQLELSEGQEIKMISEGNAKILLKTYKTNEKKELEEQEVFYNPVQVQNIDYLTVFVINNFAERLAKQQGENFKGIKILDLLAATGLRTIRFATELNPKLVQSFHTNDISPSAVKFIKKNFEINKLDQSKIIVTEDDANALLFKSRDAYWSKTQPVKYDVIDLDPYGSAVPFIDTAIQAIAEGGLICCTFTDLRVLCGADIVRCFYLYGSTRVQMECHQENALRVVLYTINSMATKHCKHITPIVSYQSEFYLRVFFTVHTSKSECGKSLVKYGNVYHCTQGLCSNFHVHPLGRPDKRKTQETYGVNKFDLDLSKCNQCGGKYAINGPIWIDELNDLTFVNELYNQINHPGFKFPFATKKKINGMLHGILEEGETRKYPLSLSVEMIAKWYKSTVPNKDIIRNVLKEHGYEIQFSYVYPNLWKSNAPVEFFFEFIKAWRIHVNTKNKDDIFKNIEPNSPVFENLQRPPKYDFKFTNAHLKKNHDIIKVPKFFPNPEKNWGPKKKATTKKTVKVDAVEKEGEKSEDKEEEKIESPRSSVEKKRKLNEDKKEK